jgi:hypothetical protein
MQIQVTDYVDFCFGFHYFFGLAYQGSNIVFRFIIKCSSLRHFGPKVVDLFLYKDFLKIIFLLVLRLEISYRVMIYWKILVFFRGFFLKIIFLYGEIWNFHNSSFTLKIFFNVNGKAIVWHTLCFQLWGLICTHTILYIFLLKLFPKVKKYFNFQILWSKISFETTKKNYIKTLGQSKCCDETLVNLCCPSLKRSLSGN